MLGNNKSFGIDIGDDAIRIVELRTQGSEYELLQAANIPLPEDRSPEAFADALSMVTRNARVAIAIPASGCAFKTSILPPAKPAELEQVIKFEAESQFPLPIDELTWGYSLSPTSSGETHAAIVGARRSLVEERLDVLRQIGVEPAAVLVTPLAAAMTVSPAESDYLLVVAGAEWTDICLFSDGCLQGCRSVLAGFPAADGWADRLIREIRPWLASTAVSSMVVLGEVTPDAITYLQQILGLAVVPSDPWHRISNAREYLKTFDESPATFATAIGLAKAALRRKHGINLLPKQLVDARSQRRKSTTLISVLLLAAIMLAPLAYVNNQALHDRQTQLTTLSERVRRIKQSAKPTNSAGMSTAEKAVSALAKAESNPLELLRALSLDLPDGIILTDFSFDRGRTAVIKGRATSYEVLSSAMDVISHIDVVDHAMLDYSNKVSDENGQGYDFQVTCTLPPTTDPTSAQKQGQTNSKSKTETTEIR
ncbi:MAG TPA: pilus assembly protein PilM [Armatimonadota bacterium]|nr:pilus assembly protein PilM [Armatimonadota bacterium]